MTKSSAERVSSEILWEALPDVEDPYVGLEDSNCVRVQTWVAAQNSRTMTELGASNDVNALARWFLESITADDRIAQCSRRDGWGYNFWSDLNHPLGLLRRTPWQEWLDGKPVWETVLDVGALDLNQQIDDDTCWTLSAFELLYPTYDRALVLLSPSGADACVVREFDMEARSFVDDGFVLCEPGVHKISWIDRDTVYVGWDDSAVNAAPALTVSGYPRQVRRWTRGSSVYDAPVVFEGLPTDLGVDAHFEPVLQRHIVRRAISYYEKNVFWWNAERAEWCQYDVPLDADVYEWKEWLLIELRSAWRLGDTTYASGSLLALQRSAFLAGKRGFTVLFSPEYRQVLAFVTYTRQLLVVCHKAQGVPQVTLWQPPTASCALWQSRGMPLPADCSVSIYPIDWEHEDTVLIGINSFLAPPSLHFADLSNDAPWQKLAALPARFDAMGYVAERRHAVAPDGVQIPYWVIGREADLKESPQPCLLIGYGGFMISMDEPRYLERYWPWLERHGVIVIASIRGGGEFGPAWHEAALRERRQVAFDDFIAVAEHLSLTSVTTPPQLAIYGGSNGGLLTATCMVQRPELFGAVVSHVPLVDMARFHLLLRGASWINEYGDPDNTEDLDVLMAYSPYQNVKAGVPYPAFLLTTTSTDDRVHPGHARKMAARMQAQGHANVWYLENRDGGHGMGVKPEDVARVMALTEVFLRTATDGLCTPDNKDGDNIGPRGNGPAQIQVERTN
ncbi:prolyl oligopeptidase family serine peptidase [Cupriavidus consociatus]|uniref:prolyl oligopeptidase family serine peptidase n=1 Tax=Cupriavidus consociatus TaxID=2821357 RepID=UPI001AE4127E|nr:MULTISPECIES: prolyl oligopeptidase family serine peptidase [unclassified Cupriavidus]MBP0625406.1 S9 family peptidase [Cupriavidus sp. LEh25]MDK2662149.1 prolyl oligopeptidase family serine peptidase [Cupriavidus sp. LEh21]